MRQQVRVDNLTIDISFSCVCLVVDHEFCYNIIKVTVNPQGSADYFDNVIMKFILNNRTDTSKTDANLVFMITNCQIVHSHLLTHCINYKSVCPLINNEK